MPPKQKEILIKFNSEEHFLQYFNEQNQKLLIVDIHPHWSGHCDLMAPNYKFLSQNYEDYEKRIEFTSLEYEKLKTLKDDKNFQTMCMPKFLFIIAGKVEDQVLGANIPEFNEKVKKHIPYPL